MLANWIWFLENILEFVSEFRLPNGQYGVYLVFGGNTERM